MGASIQINAVTQQVAEVAFGSTVTLTNAAPTGTSQKWEVIDYPRDFDDAGPDFATNFPAWTLAGDGSYFINQTPAFAAVTFKPDVTGTYLIKLSSVETPTTQIQFAVVRVKEAHTGENLPAAQESVESGSREGWKKALNGRLKRLGKRMQGYVRVANVSGSTIARGKVVRLAGSIDAHTVSPNVDPGGTAAAKTEKIFTIVPADNTAAGAEFFDYAVLDETLLNNGMGWAQKFGLFEGKADVNYTGFTAGFPVYFDSTGTQLNAFPTSGPAIAIGSVVDIGSTGTIAIQGASAARVVDKVWDFNVVRYYIVDYDAGNDSNRGYIDAAEGTDLSASAAPFAIKTLTRLRQIMSSQGNGQRAVVLAKPRAAAAVYRNPGNSADDDLDLKEMYGYATLHVRPTSDFSNSATDKVRLGFVQKLAGPGGAGEWTCTGTPTASVFSVASGTLTAEPVLLGYRVRFLPTTTTVALRDKCGMIYANSSSQITLAVNLPATPVSGDTFVIEQPGFCVNSVVYSSSVGAASGMPLSNELVNISGPDFKRSVAIIGVRCVSTTTTFPLMIMGTAAQIYLSGIVQSTNGLICNVAPNSGFVSMADTYIDEGGTVRSVGFGVLAEGRISLGTSANRPIGFLWERACSSKAASPNEQYRYVSLMAGQIGQGNYYGCATYFIGLGTGTRSTPADGNTEGAVVFGNRGQSNVRPARILGASIAKGMQIFFSNMVVYGADIQDCAANAAVLVRGHGVKVVFDGVTGGTGNTGVSFDVSGARRASCLFGLTLANTISSAGGDILVAGDSTAKVLLTDLAVTNVVDNQGNELMGSAGVVVPIGGAVLVRNMSGGTLNVGDLVRSNGTTSQITSAQADTSANVKGPLMVMLTTTINSSWGYAVPLSSSPWINFTSAPAAAAMAFVSLTAAQATATVPPVASTNQKRRLGHVVAVSGSRARLTGSPELLGALSDGVAD